ncbi:MAG: hypothetical protein KIB00_17560 [Paeniclostridium sordellii]|nr:hypothetical protein [Paeniclostridium sordellii]
MKITIEFNSVDEYLEFKEKTAQEQTLFSFFKEEKAQEQKFYSTPRVKLRF